MLVRYVLEAKVVSTKSNANDGTDTDGVALWDQKTSYNIAEAPLYFVRSGHIYNGKETDQPPLRVVSVSGYAWSSGTVDSATSTTAYALFFSASDAYPLAGPGDRILGFPLRCLSTTAVGTASTGSQ